MKLFSLFATATMASTTANSLSRNRREAQTMYSITGNESSDELLELIVSLAGEENDALEREIMQLMGADHERSISEEQQRKFRNLKVLVLWLQLADQFGRYCYYGCYCLPEGSHEIANGGYGRPLDNIDRACFDFKQCYHCLKDQDHLGNIPSESGQCIGEEIGYQYNLNIDNETGEKSIECTNRRGTCRRNICECDKKLAEQLGKYESEWNESLHKNRGGFVREDNCFKGTGGNNPIEECCGNEFTFPLNKPRRANQCCSGAEVKDIGTC